jgi:hypothetical protein
MCLYVSKTRMNINGNARQAHAYVSNRPLVVLKRLINVLSDVGYTPYQRTPMRFGVRNDITNRKGFDIYNYQYNDDTTEINGGGFHAVMYDATSGTCSWMMSESRKEWYPAIIPAGTKFFIGVSKDVVARSLIVYRNMRDLEAVHGKMSKERKPVETYSKRAPR